MMLMGLLLFVLTLFFCGLLRNFAIGSFQSAADVSCALFSLLLKSI